MAAQLIDGKTISEALLTRVKAGVDARLAAGRRAPALPSMSARGIRCLKWLVCWRPSWAVHLSATTLAFVKAMCVIRKQTALYCAACSQTSCQSISKLA